MTETIQTVTYLFGACTVLLGATLAITVLTKLTVGAWVPPSIEPFLRRRILHLTMLFSCGAVAISFFYSEVVGFPVCVLCWFARTMMIPIAILSVVAFVRKDVSVWPYTFTLSCVGMGITLYHHLYQMGVVSGTFCTMLADGGNCAQRYIFEFGFVTMPWMGFTLFSTLALLSWMMRDRFFESTKK